MVIILTFEVTYDELLEYFKSRQLNAKTNNMIVIGNELNTLVGNIPNETNISFIDDDILIKHATNIKIDLTKIDVKDILIYVLRQLKLVDDNYNLSFDNKFVLLKFNSILQNNNRMIQLIFYHMDDLSIKDQMLLNELYYFKSFNSQYFNVISLTNEKFKTYFLSKNRVLDDREDYQEYKIKKSYELTKRKK